MKRVIATFSLVGFHYWPQAPVDVAYLRHRHRHQFSFRVEHAVDHGNRAIEFHTLSAAARTALCELYPTTYIENGLDFGDRSCEAIAQDLLDLLSAQKFSPWAIEVWEDAEHGARVETST